MAAAGLDESETPEPWAERGDEELFVREERLEEVDSVALAAEGFGADLSAPSC